METLVFLAFPALAALIGMNGRAIAGWRCFACAAAALYLGVWLAPLWVGLLDFLPSEAEPYRLGAALLVTAAAVFAILFSAARAIAGNDDDFEFPPVTEKIVNVVCRAGFGIALAALLFTVCCMTIVLAPIPIWTLRLMRRNALSAFALPRNSGMPSRWR